LDQADHERVPGAYTVYEWHTVDAGAGRVIVYMQNRRDHPSGKEVIDFPGVTLLDYAGGGLWNREEDFWDGTDGISDRRTVCGRLRSA